MVSFLGEGRREAPAPALTAREREMVELVARGLNNLEIAAAASISRNTVKQHLKHVFEKTGVRSRAELAARFAAQASAATASTDGARPARFSDAPVLPPRSARP
jgi:DNA-binding CsgD family transcriptional regulator